MGLYGMKTNKRLETEGVMLDLDHSVIRVARAGGANMRYNMAQEKIYRENKRALDLDLMTNEKSKRIFYELYADTIVLGWWTKCADGDLAFHDGEMVPLFEDYVGARYRAGIELPDGSIGPATKANILMAFNEIDPLFPAIKETAEGLQYFRENLTKDIVGN